MNMPDHRQGKGHRRLPAWGGHVGQAAGFDTRIPVKGRAGVGSQNIHQISPNMLKIRLEFRCSLSELVTFITKYFQPLIHFLR